MNQPDEAQSACARVRSEMTMPPMILVLALWAIERGKPIRTALVAAELKCTPRHARRLLRKLEIWGVVERQGAGEHTRWRPYTLEVLTERLLKGSAP